MSSASPSPKRLPVPTPDQTMMATPHIDTAAASIVCVRKRSRVSSQPSRAAMNGAVA